MSAQEIDIEIENFIFKRNMVFFKKTLIAKKKFFFIKKICFPKALWNNTMDGEFMFIYMPNDY